MWCSLYSLTQDLILPRTGSGTEAGETTPATWPFFELMHKALGDKDSVKPLNLISTTGDVAGNQLDKLIGIFGKLAENSK